MPHHSIDLPERFWKKVRRGVPEQCWMWTGSRCEKGYGLFKLDGRLVRAHRLAAGLRLGDGLIAMHKCDNPSCVNPAHLSIGSHGKNVADCISKGRRASFKGERNGSSRLTEADVIAIRKRFGRIPKTGGGGYTQDGSAKALAEEFGITHANLMMIVRRQTWAHVGGQ